MISQSDQFVLKKTDYIKYNMSKSKIKSNLLLGNLPPIRNEKQRGRENL